MAPRVYLAGPDVFFPDPEEWSARKKAICEKHGLTGVSPMDDIAPAPAEWTSLPFWRLLSARNETHMRGCQGIIANLTPFRGPSADVGTVYEIGFARALGLKLWGYATVATPFLDRTLAHLGGRAHRGPNGAWFDGDGLLVEEFGLFDNLMIEGGIVSSGGGLITGAHEGWTDLTVFEECVAAAAKSLIRG